MPLYHNVLIREQDGSPSIPGLRELIVPSGSLTDEGNGVASLNLATLTGASIAGQAIINGHIVASVAGSALTLALKTFAGADPSASDPVYIMFRNSTASNGQPVLRTVTGALSLTIPSGATLGHVSARTEYIFVYAIDNAGTIELAVATHPYWDEGDVASNDTTLLDTSSDLRSPLYSATARTNVPIRQLARVASLQATAGTWNSAPNVWNSGRLRYKPFGTIRVEGGNGFGSTNTKIRRFNATAFAGKFGDPATNISYVDSSTNGGTFTIEEHGIYAIQYGDSSTLAGSNMGLSVNSSQLTTNIESITNTDRMAYCIIPRTFSSQLSWVGELIPGDVIRAHGNGVANGTGVEIYFEITQIASFKG